jgi:hypothetical protein
VKLYPIINLNLDENSFSVQDISGIYDFLINAISKSEDKDSLEAVEFSLACPQLYTNLPNIIAKLKEANIPLALASLISVDQVLDLKSTLEGILIEPIEIFSPAFDDDIVKLIQSDSFMKQYFNYIPGVYSESDIDEVLKLTETSMRKIKIYPMDIGTPQALLEALQGPYPELRSAKLRSRIITVTEELAGKYQPYEKISTNPNLAIVTSPRDYQKIRKNFMLKSSMKLVFKPQVRDPQDLVNYIQASHPKTQIVIAGLGTDLKRAKSLKGAEFIATRMFKSVLFDMLSGAISDDEARIRITNELHKYSTISA